MPVEELSVSRTVETIFNAEGGILMDTDRGVLFSMNEIGSYVWKLLAEGASRGSVTKSIAANCNVTAELIAADIDAFLAELGNHRLVISRKP